jgi:hypothetical protein
MYLCTVCADKCAQVLLDWFLMNEIENRLIHYFVRNGFEVTHPIFSLGVFDEN